MPKINFFTKTRFCADFLSDPARNGSSPTIKNRVAESVMLAHPRFDKPFHLCPNSSDHQIGCALLQSGSCLGLFSKKLNETQRKCPTTGKELLAIDKGCQCFDNVTRGGEIKIHSDHKNLTFGDEKMHTSQRALRAQTRINEVHGAEILHVSGDDNVGGDGLIRLDTKVNPLPEEQVF